MPAEVSVPMLGESVLEATVGPWRKQEGQPIAVGEVLVELETDKVNAEVAADRAGTLEHILHPQGDIVHPGDVLATIAEVAPPLPRPPQRERAGVREPSAPPTETASHEAKASPIAERLAAERGVDLAHVRGTGPGGRVLKEDVRRAAQVPLHPRRESLGEDAVQPPPTDAHRETRQRLTRRRLTIARRLVEAQHAAAMLTTFNEIDMTAVIELRAKQRQTFKERHGVDLGFMSFFTKASVAALKLFPQVNAELQGEELVLKNYYDVGVAIGDPEGLVVPVLRDAQDMTFAQIEQAIAGFVQRSRDRALTLQDLRGGTFTITNGGVYGSLMSTPILNPPQVAILGLHKIEPRPVVVEGQIAIRPMMYVALSYDHRVVDGREAVQFLTKIKQFVEQPALLLLDS